MGFWYVVLGVIVFLIGYSVWWDDKEVSRLIELEQMHKEHSPELYDTTEDEEFEARWGSFAPYAAAIAALFYWVRGIIIGAAGGVLVVLGIM